MIAIGFVLKISWPRATPRRARLMERNGPDALAQASNRLNARGSNAAPVGFRPTGSLTPMKNGSADSGTGPPFACGQDGSLRVEIESLLSAYSASDGLSTRGWLEPAAAGAAAAGRTIGSYRLISKLVAGKHDEAISVLSHAVQHGLRHEKLVAMQTDADLKSLHSERAFKAVVADGRQRATTAAKLTPFMPRR